jgi:hypothetical protein
MRKKPMARELTLPFTAPEAGTLLLLSAGLKGLAMLRRFSQADSS